MNKIKWLQLESVLIIHDTQLLLHGGREGVRDRGLLESALARPENQAACGEPDLFNLASAYAFGIVSNRPFIGGNKRTGFLASYTFLFINDWHLAGTEADAYLAIIGLAEKEMNETSFASWLRDNTKKKRRQ